jgi:bacillithiol system protein YtxJ
MKKISTIEQFEQLLQDHDFFLFLKHSITCPISKGGYDEFEKFSNEHPHIPAYFLHVQDARPLSDYIAEKLGIKHESPQVFIINKKKVKWHASHWNITSKAIAEQI